SRAGWSTRRARTARAWYGPGLRHASRSVVAYDASGLASMSLSGTAIVLSEGWGRQGSCPEGRPGDPCRPRREECLTWTGLSGQGLAEYQEVQRGGGQTMVGVEVPRVLVRGVDAEGVPVEVMQQYVVDDHEVDVL